MPISIKGSNTYYGQRQLVDRIIEQWLTANKTKFESKSGAFGTVYKVTNTLLSPNIKIDNKKYYVKHDPKEGWSTAHCKLIDFWTPSPQGGKKVTRSRKNKKRKNRRV